MKHDEIIGYGGTVFGTIMTAIQSDQALQIIQGILTIIGLLITIAYTIWKWYKNASKDGKITLDEVDSLMEELKQKGDSKSGNNN